MNFVATNIYQKAVQLALKEGMPGGVIRHLPPLSELSKEVPYVSLESLWGIYRLTNEYLQDGFGIRLGQQMTADDYGTLGLSWKTCWSAQDVLYRTERYMILVTNYGSIKVSHDPPLMKLFLLRPPQHKALETSNETSFAMLAKIIKDVTAKDIHPVSVSFQHAPPEDTGLYHEYFQCPVKFNQDNNSMYYKAADLKTPTVKADKSIHQFIVDRMEEETKGIHINANKLIKDVQHLIEESLPSGIPSVIQIGERLGLSSRTLKRRLTEHGLTFRELVKKKQEDISIHLLRNSTHSIGEIAFQTGYSEQSAFNRAFKRWTGQSPIEFRKTP